MNNLAIYVGQHQNSEIMYNLLDYSEYVLVLRELTFDSIDENISVERYRFSKDQITLLCDKPNIPDIIRLENHSQNKPKQSKQ